MKLAFVVPRYGTEIVGGAEHAARMIAERVAEDPSWDVEIFTTCAQEIVDWSNVYTPGSVEINGVRVNRFEVTAGRDPDFFPFSEKVLRDAGAADLDTCRRWIDMQGPISDDLIEAVSQSTADRVAFYPYLYHPTVNGVDVVGSRAVMHPAAHDEAPIRLPIFEHVFESVPAFVFQTESERRFVESMFPIADRHQVVLGLGVEERAGSEQEFRRRYGLEDRPYVVCLGRVDDVKGARLLSWCFRRYKELHPSDRHALVFVGPVIHDQSPDADVIQTGAVDEDLKWGALRGADVLVSASPFEAFSLVIMEAWQAGTPIIVNAHCGATVEHARRSDGGMYFADYYGLQAAFDRLFVDPGLRRFLAANGQAYVRENFTWSAVIDRYKLFLESSASG